MKSLMLMTSASVAAFSILLAAGCESGEPLGPVACSTTEVIDPSGSSASASSSSGSGTQTTVVAAAPAPKEIVEPVYFDQAPVASSESVKKAADKPAAKAADKSLIKAAAKPADPAKAVASNQSKPIPQPVVINEPLATRPALAPAPDAKKLRTYSVQKGDTLYGISRKFYNGNALKYKDIIRANPGVNPDRLLVGSVLNIP